MTQTNNKQYSGKEAVCVRKRRNWQQLISFFLPHKVFNLNCACLFSQLTIAIIWITRTKKKERKSLAWTKRKDCVMRMGHQIITFRAGFTASPRQQHRIITVQSRAVLFDVLTVYFPKHLSTTALLLPEKHQRNRHISRSRNPIWEHTVNNSAFLGQQLITNSSGVRASSACTDTEWEKHVSREVTLRQNLQVRSHTGHSAWRRRAPPDLGATCPPGNRTDLRMSIL